MEIRRNRKKAIAPIVATLILVVFAITFGIVIMTFGKAQIQQEAVCTIDIGLDFLKIDGEEQVCFDKQTDILYFAVENWVNVDVSSLKVNVVGLERARSFDLTNAAISKAGVYKGEVGFNIDANGEIMQVKIIPNMVPFDKEVICIEQGLVISDVKEC